MKVLVACEESQEVCKAFRALGHEAYSCDIQEPSGGHPEWHILGDALKAIDGGQVTTIFSPATCLTPSEIIAYIGDKGRCYGWHMSNLRIYDTPRELSEFRRACPNSWYCESCAMYWENNGTCGNERLQLKRPPQSWCYVEEMKNV